MLRICAGLFKGKHLKLPPESVSRPSSDRLRQAVFNILTNMLNFNELSILDAFAGSGALGLEALSRGAKLVVFCENNPQAQKIIKENILNTKATYADISITGDVFKLKSDPFNLIFLDPPYDMDLEIKALEYLLEKKLISENGIVVIEQRKGSTTINHKGFTAQEPRVYGKCKITILQLIQPND
jgi:16S rRNA (guanine966-N2)-methyltransferase